MNTAEAIEGSTDAGKFEILATRVLRLEDENCRLLEHMGVNAAGKTIANPIDSFCLVPDSNPPRFVMAAFTTDKKANLRRKWLFDRSQSQASSTDDGDLIKAAHRVEELRKDHPGAKFIVHLCTNKRIDDRLMAEAYSRGMELGLEVRFLGQSRIRDCLDMRPEGQWLRKEHLGIEAELLSASLLRDLSEKSLKLYGQEFLVSLPDSFVSTSSQRVLQRSIQSSAQSVHVVSGASGCGKSVASYQVMQHHISDGGFGIWIPGEIASKASSLEEAIEITLRSLHPPLQGGAGSIAFSIAARNRPLLLVVDDVNRSVNPTATFGKVLAWGRPAQKKLMGEEGGYSHPIVVPVWDSYWAPLEPLIRSASWLSKIIIDRMSEDEAMHCLDAALGSSAQAFAVADRRQLVATLGYDPILIALFSELTKFGSVNNSPIIAHEVMERFVDSAEAEAAIRGSFLKEEYQKVLDALAKSMLLFRELYPQWSDVAEWLSVPQMNAVRELVGLGKICRITGRAGEQRFEFRHDRVLEYHLVRVLTQLLTESTKHSDVLSDPFFTPFVGHALTSGPIREAVVDWIRDNAPLALIAGLRFLNPGSAAEKVILPIAKQWLSSSAQSKLTPSIILFEAYKILEGINSPLVLAVTEAMRTHRLLARARLANGDAVAGAIEFSDERWFSPAANDRYRDAILNRALHWHSQRLISDCKELLERKDLSEPTRCGALTLAGFIGASKLAPSIQITWENAPEKQPILIPALWAGFRCGEDDPSKLLNPMMSMWASLSDENRENSAFSDRSVVVLELEHAMPRVSSEAIFDYLIEIEKKWEDLHWSIICLLQYVDHPLVIRFQIEEAAKISERVKQTGGFSPWIMHIEQQWDPTNQTSGRRLSKVSLDTIKECWESEENEQSLRETAFNIWIKATDDLNTLRSATPSHIGFDRVLWRRAKLGDFSVVPLIKPLLSLEKNWFHAISDIWCDEFFEITDQALFGLREETPEDYSGGTTNDHFMLAHLLRDISVEVAEHLLLKNWGHLKFSPLFVQAALYLGTPRCLDLADKVILEYPSGVDAFKYVDHFYGFMTHGRSDLLTREHLDTLVPYIELISESAFSSIVEFCERYGHLDWAEIHLRTEFERRRAQLEDTTKEKRPLIERVGRHHFPSDNDLFDELDEIEQKGKTFLHQLSYPWEEFWRRHDDRPRWRRILNDWLARSPTAKRLQIVGEAILEHGMREDLDILTKFHINGDDSEIAWIISNTRFGVMRRSLK